MSFACKWLPVLGKRKWRKSVDTDARQRLSTGAFETWVLGHFGASCFSTDTKSRRLCWYFTFTKLHLHYYSITSPLPLHSSFRVCRGISQHKELSICEQLHPLAAGAAWGGVFSFWLRLHHVVGVLTKKSDWPKMYSDLIGDYSSSKVLVGDLFCYPLLLFILMYMHSFVSNFSGSSRVAPRTFHIIAVPIIPL